MPKRAESNVITCVDVFSEDGLLSKKINNFHYRDAQKIMAENVFAALNKNEKIAIEAGTGVGKTYAYLVPALLLSQKIIISTGTKNLQTQLFLRDLPIIKNILNSNKKITLLKGRANYLCLHRLANALNCGLFLNKSVVADLEAIKLWSRVTQGGDISEVAAVSENSTLWSQVTSNHDNCLGSECEFFRKCYVMKARSEAQTSDIVIVNHHLFLADIALKENGFGELLPGVNAVIFDEAHQLAEIATNFFAINFSSRQLINLADDITREYFFVAKDDKSLMLHSEKLKNQISDIKEKLGYEPQRISWQKNLEIKKIIEENFSLLHGVLTTLQNHLKAVMIRSKGLESCYKRCCDILENLNIIYKEKVSDHIFWLEVTAKGFIFNATPIKVAAAFQEQMKRYKGAWIFTSATLAVKNNFNYFLQNLGLENIKTLLLASPFDYLTQALFYLPKNLPEPNSDNFTLLMLQEALSLIDICRGRTFILFTSIKALLIAKDFLQNKITYPLLVQGDQPKNILLDEFRRFGNAVLLGTNSFWEGVDVVGDALSCVIIDKLPFASPFDPILSERLNILRSENKNPFIEYQLPQAIIALKQGIGRLIRHRNDRGILVVCDNRIVNKFYGKEFLQSLPNMCKTRKLENVMKFFERQYENIST